MVKAGVGWLCPECGHLQVHEDVPIQATITTDRKAGLRPPKPVEQPVAVNFEAPTSPPAAEVAPQSSQIPVAVVAANEVTSQLPPSVVEPTPINPADPVLPPTAMVPTIAEPPIETVAPSTPVAINAQLDQSVAATAPTPALDVAPMLPQANQLDATSLKPIELISRKASIGIGAIGILLAIIGVAFLAPNQHPLGYKTTSGVVINTSHEQTKVQFTANKKMYSFSDTSTTQVYSPGDHVIVAYSASKPSSAPVNISDKTTPLGAIIGIGTGIILLLLGTAGFISTFFESKSALEPKPQLAVTV